MSDKSDRGTEEGGYEGYKTNSQIWKFFVRLDKNISECVECKWIGAVHDSSTSNMINHLKSTHGNLYAKWLELDRLHKEKQKENELVVQEAQAEHDRLGFGTRSARKRVRMVSEREDSDLDNIPSAKK